MIQSDDPLYSSTKDEPIEAVTSVELSEPENIDYTVKKPVTPTVLNPVTEVKDFGDGMYTLKPEQPAKILTEPKPIYIDREKLLDLYPAETAAQILSDIENKNDLSPEITETLIKENIISTGEAESKPKSKRKTIIDNLTQFIYNLIYS